MILPPDATRHDDHEPDFEDLAKQSWQSFSTMKRFVSEANRLENASWRLWFMERNRDRAADPHAPRRPHKDTAAGSATAVEVDGAAARDDADDDEEVVERVACVYCEIHVASLSCHGCCHDAYCVSCFKLVHKKGHLATHTAAKIQALSLRERERLAAVAAAVAEAAAAATDSDEHHHHHHHQTLTSHASMGSDDGDAALSASLPPPPGSPPPPHSPQTLRSPDHSRHHHHHKDKMPPTARGKAKSWEIQMDMLLQRLMANSLHSDNDISVHNIDSRRSLGAADSLASFLSDTTTSEDPTAALQSLLQDEEFQEHVPETRNKADRHEGMVPVTDAWSDRASSLSLSSSVESLVGGVGGSAKVKATNDFSEDVLLENADAGNHPHKQLSVDVAVPRGDSNAFSSPTATMTPSSSASSMGAASPVQEPMPDNLTSLEDVSSSLFPSTLTKTKSRKKNSVCANCNGNHITIDCPLLENSLSAGGAAHSGGGGAAHSVGGGVDTVLRKCFTTIHNDNLSNSTHAFLGDEVSVRGGGHFTKGQFGASSKAASASTGNPSGAWSSFGMNSILEDQAADLEDTLPVLAGLLDDSTDTTRHWDAATWMVSSLATELPLDVYEALRRADKLGDEDGVAPSVSGWIHVKKPGSKWFKRFVCLYRNNLWEYLDEKETSRPIGYANLAEGSVHAHQNTQVEFAFRYFRHSSVDSPRDECWIQCESPEDATRWREALDRAAKLQAEDLFDMRPDAKTAAASSDASYELGKGRFATVRRARRRRSGQNDGNTTDDCCALKIIDKRIFWDLVAHETERDDTVIREILTQSVLTVRAGASYCPVIRLLSLFETRSLLVMELELMREGDLHEEIVTKSAVNETTASFLVASLVHAIHFCQQNGVAHRDVKLSNLALDVSSCPKGRSLSVIKLADFGMAAFIQADGMLRGRCGTPGFVAPEILTAGKGEAYPSGVDMFSVGVVTYTMLCGYEPFFGVNDEELIQMNKAVEYEFEEPEWSSISDEAKDLITLMMEKDTMRRITPLEALQHPFLLDASRELREAVAATYAASTTAGAPGAAVTPLLRLI